MKGSFRPDYLHIAVHYSYVRNCDKMRSRPLIIINPRTCDEKAIYIHGSYCALNVSLTIDNFLDWTFILPFTLKLRFHIKRVGNSIAILRVSASIHSIGAVSRWWD